MRRNSMQTQAAATLAMHAPRTPSRSRTSSLLRPAVRGPTPVSLQQQQPAFGPPFVQQQDVQMTSRPGRSASLEHALAERIGSHYNVRLCISTSASAESRAESTMMSPAQAHEKMVSLLGSSNLDDLATRLCARLSALAQDLGTATALAASDTSGGSEQATLLRHLHSHLTAGIARYATRFRELVEVANAVVALAVFELNAQPPELETLSCAFATAESGMRRIKDDQSDHALAVAQYFQRVAPNTIACDASLTARVQQEAQELSIATTAIFEHVNTLSSALMGFHMSLLLEPPVSRSVTTGPRKPSHALPPEQLPAITERWRTISRALGLAAELADGLATNARQATSLPIAARMRSRSVLGPSTPPQLPSVSRSSSAASFHPPPIARRPSMGAYPYTHEPVQLSPPAPPPPTPISSRPAPFPLQHGSYMPGKVPSFRGNASNMSHSFHGALPPRSRASSLHFIPSRHNSH